MTKPTDEAGWLAACRRVCLARKRLDSDRRAYELARIAFRES